MPPNIRRGFNRLFVVLAGLWAIYALLVFPYRKKADAFEHYQEDLRACYGLNVGSAEPVKCLGAAEGEWHARIDLYSGWQFYLPTLLLVAISSAAVYGSCRGAAVICLWVWRGFRGATPWTQ